MVGTGSVAVAARPLVGLVTSSAAMPVVSFQEFLTPSVLHILVQSFPTAQLGHAFFTTHAFQHNSDLFFRGILLTGTTTYIFNQLLVIIAHDETPVSKVNLSEASLRNQVNSVSYALTGNSY